MKQTSIGLLLLAFIFTAVAAPTDAFAKRGGDDDRIRIEYRHDDDDHDEYEDRDEDEDEDDDDEDRNQSLEIEADVYTDTTIIKVELRNGKKTVFETDADTRAEVIDVIAAKFDLDEDEIDDVLDFEIENRASRANERAKISFKNNKPVQVCTTTSSELEVEADVFTDVTIVKVINGNTRTVFETDATTTDDIVDAVVEKFDLDADDVEDALDLDVEDRDSRSSDYALPTPSSTTTNCDDNGSNSSRDAELRSRITQLQELINTLIRLLNLRLGNSN